MHCDTGGLQTPRWCTTRPLPRDSEREALTARGKTCDKDPAPHIATTVRLRALPGRNPPNVNRARGLPQQAATWTSRHCCHMAENRGDRLRWHAARRVLTE
eukprot:15446556-Alexandrium_andersonii.AAC.1